MCQSGQRYPVHYENDGYQTTPCNYDDTTQYEKKTNVEQLLTPDTIIKMASLASQMPQKKKMSDEKSYSNPSIHFEKEMENNSSPYYNDFYAPDTIPVRDTTNNILDLLQREDNLMKIQFEEERQRNSIRKSQTNQPYVSAAISSEEVPRSTCYSPSPSRNHMQPSLEMIERMYISPSSSFCNDYNVNNVIVTPSSSNVQRWANASYSNSPSPTQLPKPSFVPSFNGGDSSFVQKLNFEEDNGELNSMSNHLKMMLHIS
jgi:hypothetical protein